MKPPVKHNPARTLDDLLEWGPVMNDGDAVKIHVRILTETIQVFYARQLGPSEWSRNQASPWGAVTMQWITCGGPPAYEVVNTGAAGGWGPLLYDLAMEVATLFSAGLVPDMDTVSREAAAVWVHYMKHRADVKHAPFSDTCGRRSHRMYTGDRRKALTFIYSKAPTTLAAALERQLLVVAGRDSAVELIEQIGSALGRKPAVDLVPA